MYISDDYIQLGEAVAVGILFAAAMLVVVGPINRRLDENREIELEERLADKRRRRVPGHEPIGYDPNP